VCRPFVQCSAQVSPDEARSKLCSLEGGSSGVCCQEITKLDGTNLIVRQPDVGIRETVVGLADAVVLRSIDIGESFLQNVTNTRSKANLVPGTSSPEAQHAMFMLASPGVLERGKACLIAMETARNLVREAHSELTFHSILFEIHLFLIIWIGGDNNDRKTNGSRPKLFDKTN
jgi:hypothetical protein